MKTWQELFVEGERMEWESVVKEQARILLSIKDSHRSAILELSNSFKNNMKELIDNQKKELQQFHAEANRIVIAYTKWAKRQSDVV